MKKTFLVFCVFFCLNYGNVFSQCVQPTIPTIAATASTLCSGQSATLSITSGSLNNATNWFWYSGSCGGTPVGTGTSIVISPSLSTNYFVRGEGGCVVPGVCATVMLNINQSPLITATISNPICFGQNGNISLLVSGSAPFTYSWNPNFTNMSSINGPAGVYTCSITDSFGCKTTTAITIPQTPVLSLNVSPSQTICFATSASIFAQASGGTPPYSYTLTNLATNSATTLTTSNGINATPNLTTTTQFTAMVFDGGCSNGPLTIIVNVHPPLIASGYAVNACDGNSVILAPNITSTGNGGPYSYVWSNTSSTATIGVMASLTNTPATYTVIIDDGCSIPNTSAVFTVNVSSCVGLKENKNSEVKVSFYPNPANDLLSIDVENTPDAIKIKLFSILGQEILQQEIINTKSIMDLSALNSGMYYLSVYSKNEKLLTEKVIIQH
jgi:Secretion system C-terminal sorting domain/Ig-like domain CHU_C associated/SprB repeat